MQPVPDDPRRERAAGVGEVPGVDLRASVQQQRGDDEEDHAQHEPRRPRVRPGEPGRPALTLGVVAEPDRREGDQPGQNQHREQVLQESQRERVTDPGDREPAGEQVPVGLDDREEQDDEAPERDEVSYAGDGPLEQLPLAEYLRGLDLGIPAGMRADRLDPLRRGLPGSAEQAQPPQPAPRDGEGGHGDEQAYDDSQGHEGPPPAASAASVRRGPGEATPASYRLVTLPARGHPSGPACQARPLGLFIYRIQMPDEAWSEPSAPAPPPAGTREAAPAGGRGKKSRAPGNKNRLHKVEPIRLKSFANGEGPWQP